MALNSLASGRAVLAYDADGREEETDIIMASQFVKPEHIRLMRKDGGGLICTTVPDEIAEILELPFLVDVFKKAKSDFPLLSKAIPDHLPYDTKSAFSLTINNNNNYTGITDTDRSMTVVEFAKMAGMVHSGELDSSNSVQYFCDNFRIPGHLHLLRAAKGLLDNRKGHTELSTAMCFMAGLVPSATICEMMGDSGRARSVDEVKKYALANDLVFLEGSEVIQEWNQWSK